MIILIDENKQLEYLIDEANFSEMGVWERTHMEEWIAERPDILGEPLLTITTEYAGFDKTSKRLDILAVDKSGKLVVIELKRDVADVFVDLQAIHYAAYCSTLTLEQVAEIRSEYNNDSNEENESEIIDFIETDFTDFDNQPRIILVANDFKEETLAAVLWLRDSGVDITCVKLEAYNIGKKIVITPDVIFPLPEAKKFMIYRETKTKSTTNKFNQMYEFWATILKKLKEINPEIKRNPIKSSYLPIFTGHKGIHFEWYFRKKHTESFRVGLHFEKPNREDNEALLKYFRSKEIEIKKKLSTEEVIFDENWMKIGTQIYIHRNSAALDEANIKWGAETMAKFYDTLKPILEEYYGAGE